jgi:hypothetical protein
VYLYEVKQRVQLEGAMVALMGKKNITKTRSEVGTDLTFTALIDATLADGKTAC